MISPIQHDFRARENSEVVIIYPGIYPVVPEGLSPRPIKNGRKPMAHPFGATVLAPLGP